MSSKKINCPIGECNITSINNLIECPYCNFKACLKCNKYYILNKPTPSCMSCNKIWNNDFVDTVYPKSFRKKDLKIHQENIMYEKQKAMFPETSEIIAKYKIRDKYLSEIEILKKKIYEYEKLISELTEPKNKNSVTENKIIIIKECPDTGCRGYLNNKNTCTICETVLCSECELIKINDDHECNKDDIKTVILKKSTSKHCPKCSKITFKVNGCSQVWCPPPCNNGKGTAWDFNTGQIDNGIVHSPDYYDYMRKNNNGIVPLNVQNICIRRDILPDIWRLQKKISYENFTKISDIHRFFNHLRYVVMNKYYQEEVNEFDKNKDLRIKYLNKEINKDDFKKTLFAKNKRENKKTSIYQNLDMLYNVGIDIFNSLVHNYQDHIDIKTKLINPETILEQFENIRIYYNSTIKKTKERYDCKSLDVSKIVINNFKWSFSH
jgi:hypothetical protein